jgi:hypothetical protein
MTPQPNDDNWFERTKADAIELGKKALSKVYETEAGKKALDTAAVAADKYGYLYREKIAPPLTAALLVANSNYREQNKNLSLSQQFDKAQEDSKRSAASFYKDQPGNDWRRSISPGRAMVALVGNVIPGEQGTDKIDWSNTDSVESYFTSGAAQFWSGLVDTGVSTVFDPFYRVGKGIRAVKTATLTRPVSTKSSFASRITYRPRVENFVTEINDGVAGIDNGIKPLIDAVEKSEDIQGIIRYGVIADSSNPEVAAQALRSAYATGGREGVGDVLKVMIGDTITFNKLVQRNDELSVLVNKYTKRNDAIEAKIAQAESSIFMGSRLNLSAKKIQQIEDTNKKLSDQIELLKKKQDSLKEEYKDANKERKNLEQRIGATPTNSVKALEGTGTDTLLHSANTTWSKFSRLERIRTSMAEVNAKGYWGEVDPMSDLGLAKEVSNMVGGTGPRFIRAAYWLSPNQQVREVPAGNMIIDGIPAKFSYKEVNARLQQAVKYGDMSSKTARAAAERYSKLTTPSERFQFAERLQRETMLGIIRKQFPEQYGKLSKTQLDAVDEFANHIIRETNVQRTKLIRDVLEKNYTLIDSRSGAALAQLEIQKLVQQTAESIAAKRGGPVGTADLNAARASLMNDPAFATQLPNNHFAMNMKDVSDIVKENHLAFKGFLQQISADNLSPQEIKRMIAQDKKFREANQGTVATMGDIAIGRTKVAKDRLTDIMDIYQTFIWKPTTLLSLKYTTRNVFEGWLRVAASAMDMNSKYGYSWTDMIRGGFGETLNAPYRIGYNIAQRGSARVNSVKLNRINENLIQSEKKLSLALGGPSKKTQDFIDKSIKAKAKDLNEDLLMANDSVSFPLAVIDGKIKTIGSHIGSANDKAAARIAKNAYDKVVSNTGLTGPEGNIVKALLNGDFNEAYRISSTLDAKTVSKALDHIGNTYDELAEKLAKLDKKKLSPGLAQDIKDLEFFIGRLDKHIDNAKIVHVQHDTIRGKFVAVQKKASAKSRLQRSYEDKVEIADGVFIGQSLAGDAGQMMRESTSTKATTMKNVLNNDNRITGLHAFSSGSEMREIRIDEPLWVSAHSEYINNVVMKDAVSARIVQGLAAGKKPDVLKNQILKWLKSTDPEARQYMRDQKANLQSYKDNNLTVSDLVDRQFVQIRAQYLPDTDEFGSKILVDIDGKAMSLTKAAASGKLTADVSANIPLNVRYPVMANAERVNSQAKVWRNIVSTIFHYVATLPEDHLVRHPFYNMVHDAEARRISTLIRKEAIAKGKTKEEANELVAKYADKIKNTASTRAYKELMQRLYSIERQTDVGSFMRFVQPFYMAHQNSSRFWLGTTIRNPQIAALMANAYNAPYRAGVVYDEDGNLVPSGNPWSTRRDTIVLGLGDTGLAGYVKRKTGKTEARFDPTAIDVITQGQLPVFPTVGGPFGQTVLSSALVKSNPDEIAMKLFGKNAEDIVNKYIMPYYEKTYGKTTGELLATNLNPMNSWMISAMAAIRKGNPRLATDEANARFNARYNAAYDYIVMQKALNNQSLNDDEIKLEAARLATNTLFVEMASAFLGPIVGAKLGDTEARNIETQFNRLRKANGGDTDKAAIELTMQIQQKYNTPMASTISNIITTRSTDNRLGLLATPQTLKNLETNKTLVEDIDYLFPDNPFIGELISAGNPTEDYSQFVEDKMFSMELNGEPLRGKLDNPEERAKRQQYSMAWELYFNNIEYIEQHARDRKISKNSDQYKETYGEWKKDVIAKIEEKFPLWATRPDTFQLDKATNNLAIANRLLADEKFMSTVGKDSKAIQGLRVYMEARQVFKDRLAQEAARTGVTGADTNQNRWILEWRDDVADSIIEKYPEFGRMFDRYISNDKLEDIPSFTELNEGL